MTANEFPWKIGIGMISALLATEWHEGVNHLTFRTTPPRLSQKYMYTWDEKISEKRAHEGCAITSSSETKVVRKYQHGMTLLGYRLLPYGSTRSAYFEK